MAGLQTIKNNKTRKIKGYRLTIKTPNAPIVYIQLSAKQYTERDAQHLHNLSELIEDAYRQGDELSRKTLERLDLYPDFKRRLAEKRLIDIKEEITLETLWSRYIEENETLWRPCTVGNKERALRRFNMFFSPSQLVCTITAKEAQAFRGWLDSEINKGTIKEATGAGCIRDVKACFNWAVQNEILDKSPFEHIRKGSFTNDDRNEYIELERVKALLPFTRSIEFSAFLWVVRRLGLRVTSETNSLLWDNVDFQRGIITILSSKTANHKGKDRRTAPLFPDIKERLIELKEEQERNGIKTPFVFHTVRGEEANIRTRLYKLIERANGIKWGKAFQNLRRSASVDVFRTFGEDAENAWIGHSEKVREEHYRGVPITVVQDAQAWQM